VNGAPLDYTDPSGEAHKWNTPEDKANCCETARQRILSAKKTPPNGTTICCNGEIITCNYFDQNHPVIAQNPQVAKAHDVVVICLNAHEMSHLADLYDVDADKYCPCEGVGFIHWATEDQDKKSECNALLSQIGCMKDLTGIETDGLMAGDYAAFCGADNLPCQLLLALIMRDISTKATEKCGRPAPAPPKK
jgi:hypothetical protein